MKRLRLLAVVLALLAPLTVAAPAAQALPAGCHKADTFGPSVKAMQHVFKCLNDGRGMKVVQYHTPNPTDTTKAPATSGGPSCEWAIHNFAKWCYSRTIPYLICDQFFYNTALDLHGHHCANPFYDDGQSFKDLWKSVVNLTKNHVFRACTIGALVGGTGKWAGTVVEGGEAGPVGIMVVAGIGCVGGVAHYYWK